MLTCLPKKIYATSEERKQRNRQAQAAFRERRTEYIKQLETTIKVHEENLQSLQASHRTAADECLMLRYKNSLLERILIEKGMMLRVLIQKARMCANVVARYRCPSRTTRKDRQPESASNSRRPRPTICSCRPPRSIALPCQQVCEPTLTLGATNQSRWSAAARQRDPTNPFSSLSAYYRTAPHFSHSIVGKVAKFHPSSWGHVTVIRTRRCAAESTASATAAANAIRTTATAIRTTPSAIQRRVKRFGWLYWKCTQRQLGA